MRDAVVAHELHLLGIHQDEAHVLGGVAHEHRDDHGVDAHRLARSRGAGDEQVRQLCEVGVDGLAARVQADGDVERPAVEVRQQVAKVDAPALGA